VSRLALFLVLLAVWTAAPLVAQSPEKVWRLGVLSRTDPAHSVIGSIILPELAQQGFVADRNLVVEARVGPIERLPDLARELVAAKPDVIIAVSGQAILPVRDATSTIPIVMSFIGQDPVAAGVAASWARPGGNVTGIVMLAPELEGKRLSLLHEAVPAARRITALKMRGGLGDDVVEMRAVAARAGVELTVVFVSGPDEYRTAFAAMRSAQAQALVITSSPESYRDAATLAALALEAGLPTVCEWREMAVQGCMMGYGPDITELARRSADYVVRIFRGPSPGELPIEGPTHFGFAINLKSAKALGLTVPPSLLARADEVIE
jgi:putative ABC transport system substrate-binding protein